MKTRTGAILLAAALAVAACGESGPEDQRADSGASMPALEAVTLEGDSVALADLRGQVVLLNVWATWCVPCRKEVPELQELHEAHADAGLRVVGVTVDHRGAEDQIREFMDRHGMTYDVWWDPDGSAIEEFGAAGVPLTVLIDRDGRVAWRHLGAFHADNPALREAVRTTL